MSTFGSPSSWRLCIILGVLIGLWSSGVEAGKIQLTKQPRLATLFASPQFSGNYFAVEGIYDSCYNVLKEGSVGSITLESGTEYCEVWGVGGCGVDGDGKDKPKQIFHATPTLTWNGIGGTKDEVKRGTGGLKSIRCFEKVAVNKIKLQ